MNRFSPSHHHQPHDLVRQNEKKFNRSTNLWDSIERQPKEMKHLDHRREWGEEERKKEVKNIVNVYGIDAARKWHRHRHCERRAYTSGHFSSPRCFCHNFCRFGHFDSPIYGCKRYVSYCAQMLRRPEFDFFSKWIFCAVKFFVVAILRIERYRDDVLTSHCDLLFYFQYRPRTTRTTNTTPTMSDPLCLSFYFVLWLLCVWRWAIVK